MSALGNIFNSKVWVALVTVGLIAGLAVVGGAYYVGSDEVAEASADLRALATPSARSARRRWRCAASACDCATLAAPTS
jgi:hypothetical protein